MSAKYDIGQKVIIAPVKDQVSPRDSDLEPYAGKTGMITNYYSINPSKGEVFYIYTVQIGDGNKEIVLYEDELEPYIGHI